MKSLLCPKCLNMLQNRVPLNKVKNLYSSRVIAHVWTGSGVPSRTKDLKLYSECFRSSPRFASSLQFKGFNSGIWFGFVFILSCDLNALFSFSKTLWISRLSISPFCGCVQCMLVQVRGQLYLALLTSHCVSGFNVQIECFEHCKVDILK